MKRLLLLMACAAACSADWRDTSLPPQKRAELLTAEMTLDEKIGQLTSPYGWEMYERHGDSVRLTDAFREAVQNGHIGMLWGTFRADPWTQKDLRTGLTPQLAARLAMNSPIQGSAADIIKVAMNKVDAELREREMKSKLVLQIHDELIVEVPEQQADLAAQILKEEMEHVVQFAVPLTVEVKKGKSWYDAKG